MTHEELQDLLAPYALGALPKEEQAALKAHALNCPDCRRMLADFQAAIGAMPLAVPAQQPPARVKDQLMARIGVRPTRPWRFPLALAASFLLVAGLATVWLSRPSVQVVGLAGELMADGKSILMGGSIRSGQRLATTGDADLRLAGQAAVRLRGGSEAVLQRMGRGWRINLLRGGLLNVVKPGTPFNVTTALTAITVRGTVFYVEALSPQKAYVCICAGRLHLEAPGYAKELAAETHQALVLTHQTSGTLAAPAGLLDHRNDEIQQLRNYLKQN